MNQEQHQLHQQHYQRPHDHAWARAKQIRSSHGISAPQLSRYAEDGLIRTSHIRRPGQTRGVRLYHLGDIERLITTSIESYFLPKKPNTSV